MSDTGSSGASARGVNTEKPGAVSREAIDAALAAHAQWRKRLREAILTGQSEFRVEAVAADNACLFGEWLHNLSPLEQRSAECRNVMALHAEFHLAAAAVLGLALSGKKAEALQKMQMGGSYSRSSGKLVLALNEWKTAIDR